MSRTSSALVVLLGALPGCLLVSDLDFQEGGGGGGTAASSTSDGATASASSSGSPASASSASSSTSTSTSASSSSGAGGEGAGTGSGGGGGTGGYDCHAGDGFEDVAPWALAFTNVHGQHGGILYETPPTSIAMDGDRMVFAMLLGEDAGPVDVDGRVIHEGPAGAVLVGTIDDDGQLGEVFDVATVVDSVIPAQTMQVAVASPGVALVAVTTNSTSFELIEVDLCTGAVSVLATCSEAISGGRVLTDGEGRIAFAFSSYATPQCDLPEPCQPLDESNTLFDAYLWLWDRRVAGAETCPGIRLRDPTESLDEGDVSSQGMNEVGFVGETLVAFGIFQGTSTGPGAIFEDALQLVAPQGVNRYWHARFAPSGDDLALEPVDSFDMGHWEVGGQGMRAPAASSGGLPALPTFALSAANSQPAGPFSDGRPALTHLGGSDVLLTAVSATGARPYARFIGSNGYDMVTSLSATPSGLGFAGILSGNSVDLGGCADPYTFQESDGSGGVIPGSDGGGCAYFARLESDGSVGEPLVLDADEDGGLDVGIASLEFPGGERLVVGTTTGTLEGLARTIPPPEEGFSTLYVARVAP